MDERADRHDAQEVAGDSSVGGEREITLVIDQETGRPACVLLQAVWAKDDYLSVAGLFDSQDWLTEPRPTMRYMRGTVAMFRELAKRLRARRMKGKKS